MNIASRTPLVGYTMPTRTFTSGDEIIASGLAVRSRLWGVPAPRTLVLAIAAPQAAPDVPEAFSEAPAELAPGVVPTEPERIYPGKAPINLLQHHSWRLLVELSALRHGVKVEEILSPTRRRPVCKARHHAIALIYSHCSLGAVRIAKRIGRDHTTVLHSLWLSGMITPPPCRVGRIKPLEMAL